jgi:hypothetical protein
MSQVTDGTSNTWMLGEKYLDPTHYNTGLDLADNENLYVGFDNDNCRSTNSSWFPPRQDSKTPPAPWTTSTNLYIYGSAHIAGFNVALCDGSVRVIHYDIDIDNFRRFGNREDGEVISYK